jgi:hypothetical protein
MNEKEDTIATYIKNPLNTGQIPPKQRGACRHLLGEYDPELHAWANAVVLMTMNENIYPPAPEYAA